MKNFERIETLIGANALNALAKARVAVVGLGGVGGICALTLARSGVGSLIVLDFDRVQESNINRQIIASYLSLGEYKAKLVAEEVLKVNPNCKVVCLNERFNEDSTLFNYQFDYLVDAIDGIEGKFLLIKRCLQEKIPFISSMGAAKKLDLKKLEVTEISKTAYDPLAKILRKKLRDEGIYDKIMVVSSTEPAQNNKTLGSYMPVTSTAGLMLADYIIKQIIKEL